MLLRIVLKLEYGVECIYDSVNVIAARWIDCDDETHLKEFKTKCEANLALDSGDCLTYIAPTRVNLNLTQERWPKIIFRATREHG